MRRLSTILFLFATMMTWAGNVTQSEALEKAKAFINSRRAMPVQQKMRLAAKGTQISSKYATPYSSEHEHFYVFNAGTNDGYVVVSGDDRTPAILGYADKGSFDAEEMPESMKAWLQSYADQLEYLNSHPAVARAKAPAKEHQAVRPLIKSTWNQGEPYNNMCPMDGSKRSFTGCVATAMAQIINYYKYPAKTTATIPAYVSESKGISVGAIGPTEIDWANMKDNYKGNETQAEKNAVANLMRLCGASVEMNYTANSSWAYYYIVADALRKYFDYDKGTQHLLRDNYRASEWDSLVYNELASKRPVLYGAQATGGGHAFIIDGYDKDGLYHVNWGWGGSSDGYFLLSILDPNNNSGIGASSSTDGYSFDHEATFGIQPNTGQDPKREVKMTTFSINTEQTAATKGSKGFHVAYTTETRNQTGTAYTFDLGVGVFNKDHELCFASMQWYSDLPNSYGWDAAEHECNIPDLADGTYFITNISRKKGTTEWKLNYGGETHYITATVNGNQMILQSPSVKLEGDVQVSGNMEVGGKQTVKATIKNNGSFFLNTLYLLIDGEVKGGRYFEAEPGETAELEMSFKPEKAGTKTISIARRTEYYDQGQEQWVVQYPEVATTTIEVLAPKANNLTLSNGKVMNASGRNINDNVALIQFTAKNNNNTEYNDEIRVRSLWNDGSGVSNWYSFKAVVDKELQLAPGESKTIEVEIPLAEDGKYWFNVSYKTNGSFISEQDLNDNRNINLSPYTVVVPIDEELGVASVTTSRQNAVIYDMQGRRVGHNQMKKGLYIINGKKVIK